MKRIDPRLMRRFKLRGDPGAAVKLRRGLWKRSWHSTGSTLPTEDELWLRVVERESGAVGRLCPRGERYRWANEVAREALARRVLAAKIPWTVPLMHVGPGIVHAEPPPVIERPTLSLAAAAECALMACKVVVRTWALRCNGDGDCVYGRGWSHACHNCAPSGPDGSSRSGVESSMSIAASRSPRPLLALLLAACELGPQLVEPAIVEPPKPRIEARAERGPPTPEPESSRSLLLGAGMFAADPFAHRPASPQGPWYPATGWLFVRDFMRIDEEAFWLPDRDGLLRIPRSRDMRWVRADIPCRGWLFGERDDLLWCAEETERGEEIIITELDKSGYGAPSVVARLPVQTERPSSLHRTVERQGPFIVGDRVMMPVDSGFVGAELDGDGTISFITLDRRPYAVVAHGERVAWTDRERTELYAGELPLSVIRREYAARDAALSPEWVGDSLVFALFEAGTTKLMRLTADGRLFVLVEFPGAGSILIGGGERAWLLVDDHTMYWIDAAGHGPAYSLGGRPVAHEIGSDAGLLYWETFELGGSMIHISDVDRGGVVSLCGRACTEALAQTPAEFAVARDGGGSARRSFGAVHADEPGTVGPLDSEAIGRVVRRHDNINPLRECYDTALASFPALEGRFIVRFEVDRRGRVARPFVDHKSELSGPIVRDCVFRAIRRWRFPANSAAPTAVRLPLDFSNHRR